MPQEVRGLFPARVVAPFPLPALLAPPSFLDPMGGGDAGPHLLILVVNTPLTTVPARENLHRLAVLQPDADQIGVAHGGIGSQAGEHQAPEPEMEVAGLISERVH